jgi:hypothetical protein
LAIGLAEKFLARIPLNGAHQRFDAVSLTIGGYCCLVGGLPAISLLAWKAQGILTFAGYIIGFPNDTPASIRRDIAIIQRELPLDILEFFILTPLPGSEDHKVLYEKGEWMDPDMNRYDGEHAVSNHPKMSKEVWEEVYQAAWKTFYTPEHMETLLRRGVAANCRMSRLTAFLYMFSSSVPIEGVHPLQGGLLRRKHRLDRRPGMPIEPIWSFYPKLAAEFAVKSARAVRLALWLSMTMRRIKKDPNRLAYTDLALTPVTEDEEDRLALFTHTDIARNAVEHARKVSYLTGAKSGHNADPVRSSPAASSAA